MHNNLLWDAHLSSGKKAILPAVRRQLGMISTISRNMSKKARLQLVNALALSKLTYMMCLWGNATSNHIRKAQVVLNSAARLVTGKRKTTKQRDLMEDCGWLAITEWTEYLALTQLWKTVRLGQPAYLSEKLEIQDEDKIETSLPRLKMTSEAFRWRTKRTWNKLPTELRTEQSLIRFKKKLKTWILSKRTEDAMVDEDRQQEEDRPPDRN